MGRGLSPLQRKILEFATEFGPKSREKDPKRRVDAYYHELLHHVYGLPYAEPKSRRSPGKNFDAAALGHRYLTAKASLGRSVRRLELRGLITVFDGMYGGWRAVSVNRCANLPTR